MKILISIIFVLSLTLFLTNVNAENGLVAYWKNDEGSGATTSDFSGNNHTGTLINGANWTSFGISNSAINFDGINDFISVPDSIDLRLNGSNLTLEAWVNLDSNPSTNFKFVAGKREFYYLYIAPNGKFRPSLFINGTQQDVFGTTVLDTNKWYYLVLTYDGSVMKAYVNGLLEGSLTKTGTIQPCCVQT